VFGDKATACKWYAKVIENPKSDFYFVREAKDRYKISSLSPYKGKDYSGSNGDLAKEAFESKKYADAVKYGKLGANQNEAKAIVILGHCYLSGCGVSNDNAKAVSYYQKAAEQNHCEAQFYMGVCYQFGWGVTQNNATARQWYTKVIENPNTENWRIGLAKWHYQQCNNDIPYRGK
jgi:TPR repeat protein